MIPYKTSKDYKRLKELLDEGKGVICFFNQMTYTGLIEKNCDILFMKGKDPHSISCITCDTCGTHFEEMCKAYNVEFIEPNL